MIIRAMYKDKEIIIPVRELSRGMTKLPGSRPLLNARIEMANEIKTIVMTEIMFAIIKVEIRR